MSVRPLMSLSAAALIALAVVAPAHGQEILDRDHILGVGLQMSFPYDELGDNYNTGWGVGALLHYPMIPLLAATAQLGWNTFPHEGREEAIEVWEISGGGRLTLGAFFMGGEVGWYDRGDEWSWVPSWGLHYTHFEASIRWRAVGRNAYTGLRVGWYF